MYVEPRQCFALKFSSRGWQLTHIVIWKAAMSMEGRYTVAAASTSLSAAAISSAKVDRSSTVSGALNGSIYTAPQQSCMGGEEGVVQSRGCDGTLVGAARIVAGRQAASRAECLPVHVVNRGKNMARSMEASSMKCRHTHRQCVICNSAHRQWRLCVRRRTWQRRRSGQLATCNTLTQGSILVPIDSQEVDVPPAPPLWQ